MEPIAAALGAAIDFIAPLRAAPRITGALCHGWGRHLQVREGERGAVNTLYARISAGRRHRDLMLLH